MHGHSTSVYIYNQSLAKIQLESKLDFVFVSFPYKLNCLDFCCHFFFELMCCFYLDILYAKILNVINCDWVERFYAPIPTQFRRYYWTNLFLYFVLYLVEFHRPWLWIDILYVVSKSDFQNYIHNSSIHKIIYIMS